MNFDSRGVKRDKCRGKKWPRDQHLGQNWPQESFYVIIFIGVLSKGKKYFKFYTPHITFLVVFLF